MSLDSLIATTERVIRDHERSLDEIDRLDQDIKRQQALINKLDKEIELFEDVRLFLQQLAEIAREEVASGLEKVVTLCLQAVFGETLSFEIDIDTARNNTVIDFYVLDDSGEEVVRLPPEEAMGGGVVDTVSIGLRFGMLKILNPEPKGPIMLDEPAKMVSGDLIQSIAALLQELTKMFDKQSIIVTHHTSLMDVVDNSVYFEKRNGVTQVSSAIDRG